MSNLPLSNTVRLEPTLFKDYRFYSVLLWQCTASMVSLAATVVWHLVVYAYDLL